MSRGVTSAMNTAAAQANVPALLFIEMLLDSGALRVCTAGENIAWNGFTWTGAGELGSVDVVEENDTGEAKQIAFELTGVKQSLIAIALNENIQDRPCNLWLAFLDETTRQTINAPTLLMDGYLDRMRVVAGKNASILVTAEPREVDAGRPREFRYNHETQQSLFPGDRFFEYQDRQQDKPIIWGV